jgi:putative transposase
VGLPPAPVGRCDHPPRGGYRDSESQASIGSWFGQFKKRLAWRSQWESLDQARREVTGYVDAYHHRHHSGLAYLTQAEVATTWRPDPTSYKPQRPDP